MLLFAFLVKSECSLESTRQLTSILNSLTAGAPSIQKSRLKFRDDFHCTLLFATQWTNWWPTTKSLYENKVEYEVREVRKMENIDYF